MHILRNCWNFQARHWNWEGPASWIYLKVIYYLSSTLIPKGLNIPIRLLSSKHLSMNLPPASSRIRAPNKIQCDILLLAPIISILDLPLHIPQCLRMLGSLLFWSCLLWNFPEASVHSLALEGAVLSCAKSCILKEDLESHSQFLHCNFCS